MEVKCGNCSARYRIGEDKFGSKQRIRIRCKRCGDFIQVENPALNKGGPPPMGGDDDIFSNSLPNKNELLFDDSQETQVFSAKKHTPPTAPPQKTPPQQSSGGGGFQSNFQLTFDDQTSHVQMNQQKVAQKPSVDFSGGGGMFMDQNVPAQTGQQMPPSSSGLNMGGAGPKLDFAPGKGPDRNFSSGGGGQQRSQQRRPANSSNNRPAQNYSSAKQGGGILGKLIMFIFFIAILFAVFVLFKNKWEVKLDNIGGMIDVALNGGAPEQKKAVKKETKPLSQQFLIAKDQIKAEMIRIRKGKHALSIQGKVKNIASGPKNLITIRAKVFDLEGNLLFSKRVYAGNFFTKKEIRRAKSEADFDTKYVQSGVNGMNWGVAPDQEVPFMIVFYTDKRLNLKHTNLEVKVESAQ